MRKLMLLTFLFCTIPAFSGSKPVMETGKVISQDIEIHNLPSIFASGVEISNRVLIKTDKYYCELTEDDGGWVTLTANTSINFYRAKKQFVILDKQGNKHTFSVTRVELIN